MTMTGRSREGRILVIGSSNTDLVCQTDRLPHPGETVASYGFNIYPGGKAANQAVAAARAGASVSFVGGFGDDEYGQARFREMEAEGIDLSPSRVYEGMSSGLALIAVDPAGENLIITVGGANERVDVGQLEEALSGPAFDLILLPNEAPPDVVALAIDSGSAATVVLNAAPFSEHLVELAGNVDILICNEIEVGQFLRRPINQATLDADVSELADVCRGSAVITLGSAGAIGLRAGELRRVAALEIEAVDTTGAGDAFCGAFAAWLGSGSSFGDALQAGVVAGSLAATRAGAQPSLPSRDEIAARLG
jgi:ribokinase